MMPGAGALKHILTTLTSMVMDYTKIIIKKEKAKPRIYGNCYFPKLFNER